jgi:hypothetical protein
MKYTFTINDYGPDLNIIITRALLALSAAAVMVYHPDNFKYLSFLGAAILLLASVFIKLLLNKFGGNNFVLLSLAAVVLFFSTRSISFAIILLVNGYLVKFLYKSSIIEVTDMGVKIKKRLAGSIHTWNEFSNIILKDTLLTLDFKNNKLLQLSIDETSCLIDENAFNNFCNGYMQPKKLA